jgi:C-terminal processing protease CtpA/Prc
MTIRRLLLIPSIILGCGLIIGGIVSAQEAPKAPEAATTPKAPQTAWFDDDAFDFDFKFDLDPEVWTPQGDRNFTFFFQGGTFLGVHAEDVSKENMASYGLREVRGVGVTEVVKDSPAEKAGLRKGDVIVGFNGEAVTSTRKLNRLVNESSPDQNVRLTVARGGSEQEMSATLGKRDAFNNVWNEKTRAELKEKMDKMRKDMPNKIRNGDGTFTINMGSYRRIGIGTQTLTKQLAEYFGVSEGILVTSVADNSAAAKAGLKAGDVITAIDGEKVDSPGDITRAINKKEDGPVTLTVVRDRSSRSITVTPEKPPAGTGDIRTIVVPQIEIPAVTVSTPRIVVPAIPDVNVTVPRRPVRVLRTRNIII